MATVRRNGSSGALIPATEIDYEPIAGCGEQQLAYAVLLLALADASGSTQCGVDVKSVRLYSTNQVHARVFCIASDGPWARSRTMWCDMAGVDPDAFREHAEKILRS